MTRIQELCNRVVLLKRRVREEEDGSFTEDWQDRGALWAKIVPYGQWEVFGEGWNNRNFGRGRYKVTMRFHREQFDRIQWEHITLALLCPPLIDPRRQWMSCFMYGIGGKDE
ncbi:MAG: Phage head-tail joining protein [Alphaproteobacteria bacterium]|jgi:head-tail adaptor|nr:Phage head-tail joining protein [Alphaproteobacteria bacterium]